MSEKNKVQTEDSPELNKSEVNPAAKVEPAAKKSFWNRILPWLIVALIFFIGGVVATWFALYQPKVAELNASQTEVANAVAHAEEIQTQLDDTNASLTDTQNSLTNAEATVVAQSTAIAQTDLLKVIYKFQADVNFALYKLAQNDPASSRQALSYVASDLADLETAGLEPAVLTGYQTKIEDATANLESEPLKSIETLEDIYSNLNLLISNLK